MNYYSHYQSNPIFPYKKTLHRPNSASSAPSKEITPQVATPPPHHSQEKNNRQDKKNAFFDKTLRSLSTVLEPIEKILGRKIEFDDILLVVLIYIIFTEKEGENNTLLCCLIFVLLG
ncbi:MAG: hypothetical protein J6M02_05145 [Clostridia bacterium]|nr:hypothetical protein [Clostridia bacterium]